MINWDKYIYSQYTKSTHGSKKYQSFSSILLFFTGVVIIIYFNSINLKIHLNKVNRVSEHIYRSMNCFWTLEGKNRSSKVNLSASSKWQKLDSWSWSSTCLSMPISNLLFLLDRNKTKEDIWRTAIFLYQNQVNLSLLTRDFQFRIWEQMR